MATDLYLEAADQPGALAAIGNALGAAGINMEGVCATTSGGTGHLHVLVDDAAGATAALDSAGYTVTRQSEPIVLDDVTDVPGFLGGVAQRVADAGVNIEAVYVATGTRIVLVCSDPDRAREAIA